MLLVSTSASCCIRLEYNLEIFMDIVYEVRLLNVNPRDCATRTKIEVQTRKLCLWYFFGCLAYAVYYIHLKATKHMDIKPKNLLMRDMCSTKTEYDLPYKIYIADFGIFRVYGTALESDTGSPTPSTRAYAAPEVVAQETRGLSADIFSLGCVFIEMLATLATNNHGSDCRPILIDIRTSNPYSDGSFQANSIRIREMPVLAFGDPSSEIDRYFHCVREVTYSMLSTNPNSQPLPNGQDSSYPRYTSLQLSTRQTRTIRESFREPGRTRLFLVHFRLTLYGR